MGISNSISGCLESIFNQWTKVRITDKEVKKLIQLALVPSREVLQNLKHGREDKLSTCFKNMCNNAFEYAMSSPSQLMETTEGTLFGAYNAISGYFQNVRNYRDDEAKLKSLLLGGTAQMRTQSAFNLCDEFAVRGADALLLN